MLDNIWNRVNEYEDRARESSLEMMNSDSISSMKEALQFIEAKQAIIVKAAKKIDNHLVYEFLIMQTYKNLMAVEYKDRCNYEEVIQIYKCFTSKFNCATALKAVTGNSYLEELMILIMMYRDLALIRVSNDICADSFIFRFATNYLEQTDGDNAYKCKELIVRCLRASKNFDAAIDMERKFLSIRNLDEDEDTEFRSVSDASLAITYVEKYRVEFHKHTRKENEQEFDRITQFLRHASSKQNGEPVGYNYAELQPSHAVAIAQWNFLLSKTLKKEDKNWTEMRRNAIYCVQMLIATKWRMKDNCFYCHQAPTKDKVKFVCGDCRVACYCSIDHQRVSWKKNALHDMCFGHEAICPAMKAYRKWQEAIDGGDIEKEKKMKRRFGRECLGFLAYGLGLEDKCYDTYDPEVE